MQQAWPTRPATKAAPPPPPPPPCPAAPTPGSSPAGGTHNERVLQLLQRLVSILQVPIREQLLNDLQIGGLHTCTARQGRAGGGCKGGDGESSALPRGRLAASRVAWCWHAHCAVVRRWHRHQRHHQRHHQRQHDQLASASTHPQLLSRLAGAFDNALQVLHREHLAAGFWAWVTSWTLPSVSQMPSLYSLVSG